MGFADEYFLKQKDHIFTIESDKDTRLCIVIPCFNETLLLNTLNSLWDCDRPNVRTTVIIVVNSSVSSDEAIKHQNKITVEETKIWIKSHPDSLISFHIIYVPDLPEKFAGVGLARKTGMDAAVNVFNKHNNPDGIIVSLDADCTVDRNYLSSIVSAFNKDRKTECATLFFEHQLTESADAKMSEGINKYELHLRYYTGYLRFIGYPYSYFTIGSGFAIRANRYIKQGGMNRKLAGEDFYFLHKIFPSAKTTEINETTVYPLSRISTRVPFGTGAAMKKFLENDEDILTYNPLSFEELKKFISIVPSMYQTDEKKIIYLIQNLHPVIFQFLLSLDVFEKITEIKKNSASKEAFVKRFYASFNAFFVVKYLNYSAGFFKKISVIEATKNLTEQLGLSIGKNYSVIDLLKLFRGYQRSENYISPL